MAPVLIRFKIFYQELCEAKLKWDEPLPLGKWHSLKSSLEEGQPISIPQCLFNGVSDDLVSCTLCGFCDASLKAYTGVVYLLMETTTTPLGKFIAAKTRVSPLKEQMIPRLELLSALLLSRLLTSVTQSLECELKLSQARCFTDSTVALCWIKGTDKSWKPFVQNRVDEIRKLTPPESSKHCSGKGNPADLPSRGLASLELSMSVLWRDGPDWLRDGVSTDSDVELRLTAECLKEMRVKDRLSVHGLFSTGATTGLSQILKRENFSSVDRLFAVTNLVVRFCKILLSKIRSDGATSDNIKNATAEELWILECQRIVVADKNFKQWKKQLDLFQDEKGVWRCRGRIQNAAVPYSTKHPLRGHHLTQLVVKKAHV